jgi:DNA repair protein RecN (Recombination protein N)
MLRGLHIRDMLIIDHLDLHFEAGLNVLTGETGAGKSILLDSLGFVLGWRGRAELVRKGAKQGEVTAEFDLPADHPAHAVLQEAGLPDPEELILRRVNTAEGRKTAWVNDRRVSGEVLRKLSATLVELHGQHDDRGLLNPKGHQAILDSYGESAPLLADVRRSWAALRAAERVLQGAESKLEEVRAEEDFLRHAVEELDRLEPQPFEDAQLDARRRQMQRAEKIVGDMQRAAQVLGPNGAESALGEGLRWLEAVTGDADGQLDEPLAAILRALNELSEASAGIERCLEAMRFNPAELEETEERLFALRALARKHGVTPEELPQLAEGLRAKLAALDAGDAHVHALQQALRAAKAGYEKAASALTEHRLAAAKALDLAVGAELAPLKMERAVFETQVSKSPPGPEGQDQVAFTVATNPGAPAGPLAKIASGGELSRFLLALKVCLTRQESGMTLIFDEIDRGVGGATADAVGRRLSSLAKGAQILVVTHSPQVAALGAHHWRVEKAVKNDETRSNVVPLSAADRVDEIARMISGDTITQEARAAAAALLAG